MLQQSLFAQRRQTQVCLLSVATLLCLLQVLRDLITALHPSSMIQEVDLWAASSTAGHLHTSISTKVSYVSRAVLVRVLLQVSTLDATVVILAVAHTTVALTPAWWT